MKYSVKFKAIEVFETPQWFAQIKRMRRPGAIAHLVRVCGVISAVNHLGWPPHDEQLDIASVAILASAAGGLCAGLLWPGQTRA
jgi:hypothetical protein